MTASRITVLAVLLAAGASALTAAPAAASPARGSAVSELNLPKAACGVAGIINKAVGIACGIASNGGALIKSGKQLITGHVGGAVSTLVGGGAGSVAATASTALGLAALGLWVVDGAGAVLHETAAALGATTTPQLQSTWFSSTYWRMTAIAALLTLPFLFAATIQAALRSDVSLLAKAALGYLPLAMLSIAIAAPVTTMLLAASDELCGLISSAASNSGPHLLERISVAVGGLTIAAHSPFLAFLIGMLMIGTTFALWIELLLREAAVYVVVLMLPLAFAALTWPARRIWAIRAVELLIALILSKFAILAVLSLGGAAISASIGHLGVTEMMAGTVLIMLAAMSPWALLRLVPLAEIATGAAGALRGELRSGTNSANVAVGYAQSGADWVRSTTAEMQRDAAVRMADPGGSRSGGGGDSGFSDGGDAGSGRGGDPEPGGGGDPGPGAGGGDRPAPPPEPPPPSRDIPWNEQRVLELGLGMDDTPVHPHPDAE
ncbi:MAG: hypothetical protein JO027_15125 [Solirubrobacterales bacterium]|nr:hypothetical protein [Solirubrobacterales bacterium]